MQIRVPLKNICFIFLFIISIPLRNFASIQIEKIAIFDLNKVIESVYPGNSNIIKSIKSEEQIMNDNLRKIKEKIFQIENQKSTEKNASLKLDYNKQINDLVKQYTEYYKASKDKIEKLVKTSENLC